METPTLQEIRLELLKIERRMGKVGDWNLYERWNSGRYLVELRNPETHYLPKGQLSTLAATLKVSTRELSDRMRVADTFRTATDFKKAQQHAGTWTALLRQLPPTREARTGSTRPQKKWVRLLYDALAHVLADDQLLDREGQHLAQKLYDHLDDLEDSNADN